MNSICNPCTKLLPVDICATSIIIGHVPSANTIYNIWFRSLANGFTVGYTGTSDSNKLLGLSLPNGLALACGLLYEVWVNTSNYSQCGVPLIICDTTAECYSVEFERMAPGEETAYQLTYGSSYNAQEFKMEDCC